MNNMKRPNNINNIEAALIEMGLSELEAKVYLSMLPLGDTNVLKISKASAVKRTTVYTIINSLKLKGLVSEKEIGFKKYFCAEDPKRTRTIVNKKVEDLMNILPDLEELFVNKGSSIVKYYEGIKALEAVYNELLSELKYDDYYLVFGDPERWDLHAKEYFKTFIKKRLKINLQVKLILTHSEKAFEYKKFEKNFHEEVKILPENYKLDVNVVITKNKIIIHQLHAPVITVVIESPQLISMQKNLFEIIWKFL